MKQKTSIVTCPGTLSYVHIWNPKFEKNKVDKITGEEVPIFSTMFLFPKSNTAFVKEFNAVIRAAFDVGVKQGKFNARSFDGIKKPLRDGDAELNSGAKDDPVYKGMWFFNASTTKDRPEVKISEGGEIIDMENQSGLYSGCKARILINCYPFDVGTSKGIAAGLNGILKVGEGTRLDGKPDPTTAFSKFAEEDDNDEGIGSEFR